MVDIKFNYTITIFNIFLRGNVKTKRKVYIIKALVEKSLNIYYQIVFGNF